MNLALNPVDYACLLAYLLGILALGVWVGRRIRTGKDYFLAGRTLPWWAVGMSLVATDIGGTDIIGVGGAAYQHGLAVSNFEWIGCVPAMIVGAFLFIPHFWPMGIYTIPEFMERRFHVGMRSALAICWLLFMACNLGVMLLASAKMMGELMQLSTTFCILMTAGLVGFYTLTGGLAAVVYTDTIQCVVMIVGCLLILILGLVHAGGFGPLYEKIDDALQTRYEKAQAQSAQQGDAPVSAGEYTSLVLPVDTPSPFPWTGILFGLAFILSPAYWIGNQAIVQRSFGSRSEYEAKAAYVFGALLKNSIPFLIAIPGLIALAQFPDLSDGDKAFPTLVGKLLPTGLRGIFLAAFLAALMSSMDSYLNAASTILTRDLYQRFVQPEITDTTVLWIGRATTVLLVAWAITFAFWAAGQDQGLYAIFQTLMSFFQGPTLAILLGGLLWRRVTGTGALVGFVAGVLVASSLYALSRDDVIAALGWEPLFRISEPFLYFSIWAFLTSLAFMIPVSLCTRPDSEEKMSMTLFSARARS